ncbi:MAG: LUD domain-containing protein [Candidatus Caldarchaeales archaeon]
MRGFGELERRVREQLRRGPVRGLYAAMMRGLTGRRRAIAEIKGYEGFREEARSIKERSLMELEELLEEFVRNAEARGARVHFARDAEEANEIIARIAANAGAGLVVKSKSLTSEEIELNQHLESRGVRVVETDLGERIIQLAGEKPSHLVFPAIHKSVEEVAELFSREAGQRLDPDVRPILDYVRRRLRSMFLEADVGVNGANVAIAELGAVVMETNEGNGRLSASLPRVQIVLVGIEKVVRTVEEALVLARSHAVAATGQRITTYVSVMGGRLPMAGVGDRELHFVILDNGRRRMLKDPYFREALYCIRCGACMNVCSPYGVVGGHVFGHIYPGPIGIIWTANVHGLERAEFAELCISCGLCAEVCPVMIDIPFGISRVKELLAESRGRPRVNRAMMAYEAFARLGSRFAPLTNALMASRTVRRLLEWAVGLDPTVELPRLSGRTLKDMMREVPRVPDPTGAVALFPDFHYQYVRPDLAVKFAKALAGAGVRVDLPDVRTSGYPFVAYGDLRRAAEVARRNVSALKPYVEKGYRVVSLEPTATYALRHVYPKLLAGNGDARAVADATFEGLGVLLELVEEGRLKVGGQGGRYGLHVPCHQRPLSGGKYAARLLELSGAEVVEVGDGMCCGMGGTFGMKAGPVGRGLSDLMGARLAELLRSKGVEVLLTESSVCAIQYRRTTNARVLHPLEVLEFSA